MIADLLPGYYETSGSDCTIEVLRSMVIDGHEVAWAVYTFRGDGEPFIIRQVCCECDFIQDVDDQKSCLRRKAALYLRRLELRGEYLDRFRGAIPGGDRYLLLQKVPEIILDLLERAKQGEFIGEDGNAALTWGGYFYLQLVADIVNAQVGDVYKEAHRLVAERKINLDGNVVQSVYTSTRPTPLEEVRLGFKS